MVSREQPGPRVSDTFLDPGPEAIFSRSRALRETTVFPGFVKFAKFRAPPPPSFLFVVNHFELALCVHFQRRQMYRRAGAELPADTRGDKTERLRRAKQSILIALLFSKYFYLASLTNYYTFFLISNSMSRWRMCSCTCSRSWPPPRSALWRAVRLATASAENTLSGAPF
jgi:hypothetical protein